MSKCIKRKKNDKTPYIFSELGMVDWYHEPKNPCDDITGSVRENIVYDRRDRSWHLNISRLNVTGNIRAFGTASAGQNEYHAGTNPLFKEDWDWDAHVFPDVKPKNLVGWAMVNNVFLTEAKLLDEVALHTSDLTDTEECIKTVEGIPSVDVNKLLYHLLHKHTHINSHSNTQIKKLKSADPGGTPTIDYGDNAPAITEGKPLWSKTFSPTYIQHHAHVHGHAAADAHAQVMIHTSFAVQTDKEDVELVVAVFRDDTCIAAHVIAFDPAYTPETPILVSLQSVDLEPNVTDSVVYSARIGKSSTNDAFEWAVNKPYKGGTFNGLLATGFNVSITEHCPRFGNDLPDDPIEHYSSNNSYETGTENVAPVGVMLDNEGLECAVGDDDIDAVMDQHFLVGKVGKISGNTDPVVVYTGDDPDDHKYL